MQHTKLFSKRNTLFRVALTLAPGDCDFVKWSDWQKTSHGYCFKIARELFTVFTWELLRVTLKIDHETKLKGPGVRVSDPVPPGKCSEKNVCFFWKGV